MTKGNITLLLFTQKKNMTTQDEIFNSKIQNLSNAITELLKEEGLSIVYPEFDEALKTCASEISILLGEQERDDDDDYDDESDE